MTDELKKLLDEISARADAASSGPWGSMFIGGPMNPRVDIYSVGREGSHHIQVRLPDEYLKSGFFKKGDADFIAHARQEVPILLAMIRKLIEQRDEYAKFAAVEFGCATEAEFQAGMKDDDAELVKIAKGEK